MKLSDAIALMQKRLDAHGDVDVWFDCPHCYRSFAPDRVVAVAVHLSQSQGEKCKDTGGAR